MRRLRREHFVVECPRDGMFRAACGAWQYPTAQQVLANAPKPGAKRCRDCQRIVDQIGVNQ